MGYITTEAVCSRIRVIRMQRKLTQEQFAEKADVSLSLISKLESGQGVNLTFETLNKLLSALEVSFIDFFLYFESYPDTAIQRLIEMLYSYPDPEKVAKAILNMMVLTQYPD